MITMGIYVPSMDRSQNIGHGVPRFASPSLRSKLVYVVPEAQRDDYVIAIADAERNYPGMKGAQVIGCPEKGIAKTRHWIGHYANWKGQDKFLMLDDDAWFFKRAAPDATNLVKCEGDDTDVMIQDVQTMLNTYAHVGISAREGNNRLPLAGDQTMTCVENTRTLRCLAYQTLLFLACQHGRVEVMEDFDVNLQLLEQGYKNANLCYWSQDQRQTNAPGGCSSYRSHEVQDRSARRLVELHPGIVALRQKQNKSGGEFGTRTEVTIYWKKAFQQGCDLYKGK